MAVFRGRVRSEHIGGRHYCLWAPLVFTADDGMVYTVPEHFVSDGASVPRPLWWLYPPFGSDIDEAVFLHDYLYRYAEWVPGDDHGHIERGACDGLMLQGMAAMGFRLTGRRVIHSGIRAGGWRSWQKHRRDANANRAKALPSMPSHHGDD